MPDDDYMSEIWDSVEDLCAEKVEECNQMQRLLDLMQVRIEGLERRRRRDELTIVWLQFALTVAAILVVALGAIVLERV